MTRALYLWDFADTLFLEQWDEKTSGFSGFESYLQSLGKDPKKISPQDYESAFQIPYEQGWLDVTLAPGFAEVLSWTRNNAAFTTGNREQLEWRARQLLAKGEIDVRPYFPEVVSTFDFEDNNQKKDYMYLKILKQKAAQGFQCVICVDNNLQNCHLFNGAFSQVRLDTPDLLARTYHIINDHSEAVQKGDHWQIGSLHALLALEKIIYTQEQK